MTATFRHTLSAFRSYDGGLFAFVLALLLFFSVFADGFSSGTNLQDLTLPLTLLGLVSIGILFALMAGVIDLSVGSVMGVSGVLAAGLVAKAGLHPSLAFLIAVGAGALLGSINGLLVAILRIPSFIVTLGTLAIYRAIALRMQEDFFGGVQSVLILDPAFRWFGSSTVVGRVPVSFFAFLVIALVAHYVISNSRVGIWLMAVGGNERAAHAAGVSPDRIRIFAFTVSGACASIAGLVLAARAQSAIPLGGLGFEFEAITAVIFGGASLYGGSGSVVGTVLGVIILTVLLNGLSHMGIQTYDQFFIRGLIFVGVLWYDANVRRRRQAPLLLVDY